MDVRLVASIACFIALAVAGDSKCVLPQDEKPINWNMLPGTWYHMQNTRDPYESISPCVSVANIREIPGDGVYSEHRDIKSLSSTGDPNYVLIPVRWGPYGEAANTYTLGDKYESLWTDEKAEFPASANRNTTAAVVSEVVNFFRIPISFWTNYKHFWIAFQCVGDTRNIWTFSRHPRPSDEDVLHANEALAKIGDGWDEVPLYPSGCARLNIRDPIINT